MSHPTPPLGSPAAPPSASVPTFVPAPVFAALPSAALAPPPAAAAGLLPTLPVFSMDAMEVGVATPTPMPRPVHKAQAAEERQRANCVRVTVTVTCHSREALLMFRELPQALLRDSMERALAHEIKRCFDADRNVWRCAPFSKVVVEERVQHQQRRLFREAFRYEFYPPDIDVTWDRDFVDSVAVERVEVREAEELKREHSATMLRRFVRFLLFDKRTGFAHVAQYYAGRKLPDLVAEALAPLPRRLVEEALAKLGVGLLGMAEVKREFRNRLRQFEGPNKLSAPRGILCYGPPGTGKTTLVAALLKLLDFVSLTDGERIIAAGEFAQNIVGDRERMITHFADRAAAIPWQLCMLPVDEVETLCQQRGATEGGGRNNAESLSLLLAKINGGDDQANFNMMMSTNFVEQLDQALMRRVDLKFFAGVPDAATRAEFLRHPTFGLPPAYLAAIGNAGVARLVDLTLNFSHDNMRKFISSLAPWVEGPDRISEAQVERHLRDYCDKEGLHLGGMSVCALLSEGIHTQVITDPPTLAQRTFTGKVFVSLASAPAQSDEERVQFLYNQPRSAVLLLSEMLSRAQDPRAQFSAEDARRVEREVLLSDQQLAHLLQLAQYLPASSALFREWLHGVSQSDAVRPRLEVRGLKLRSKDDVIVSLLQLAVRHMNVSAMQVINASFLFRHNATTEDAAMHTVNDALKQLREYPRSMVVFDLDSLASVTKHFMPAQPGQEGSFSYEILYKRLVQLILERFNASAEFAEEKQHVMVVMCQNPVLFTTFAEATQWPEAASAKKRKAEAEEAQKDQVCDRCWQHFTEAKNESNSCRRHIGELQLVVEGDRFANPPRPPLVKKLKHLEELSRLYEGSNLSAPAGDVRWTCCSSSGLASAGEAGAPHVVFPRLALGTRPARGAHYITNAERGVHTRTDVVGEGTEAAKWSIVATAPVGHPGAPESLPRDCCGVWLVDQPAVQWRANMHAEAERLQRPLLLVVEERGSVAAEVFAPDANGPTPLVLLPHVRAA